MVHKRLLRPERLRAVSRRFSWVDHRLVRERHVERCPSEALALYLFLVTVADAKGLSYFGDASVRARLGWGERQGRAARPGAPGADGGGFHRLRSPAVPGVVAGPGTVGKRTDRPGPRTAPSRRRAARCQETLVIDYGIAAAKTTLQTLQLRIAGFSTFSQCC